MVIAGSSKPITEEFILASKVFGNTRTIRILLPPDYYDARNARRSYPVLYLNDGVSVFKSTAIGVATVVEDLLRGGDVRPFIVVGMDNGGSTTTSTNPGFDRAMEYLPYPDVGFAPDHKYPAETPHPRGELYPKFLFDEVMPAVKARYRVSSRPADIALGGFSYGGDAALFTVMTHPGSVGGVLLESTPLWIGEDRALLRNAQAAAHWPKRVVLGMGTAEAPDKTINEEGLRDLKMLEAAIRSASPHTTTLVTIEENATHGPAAWRRRLPAALKFLFGRS